MLAGCDQGIAVENRILVQKRDGDLILIDDVVAILRVARQHLTDETGTIGDLLHVRSDINGGFAPILGHGALRMLEQR
jgi:hypothetical protein